MTWNLKYSFVYFVSPSFKIKILKGWHICSVIDDSSIMDRAVESFSRTSERKKIKKTIYIYDGISFWQKKRSKACLMLWINLDYVLNANGQLKQDRCCTGHGRWVSKQSSLYNSRRRCQRFEVDGNRSFLFRRNEMPFKWSGVGERALSAWLKTVHLLLLGRHCILKTWDI